MLFIIVISTVALISTQVIYATAASPGNWEDMFSIAKNAHEEMLSCGGTDMQPNISRFTSYVAA